MASYDVSSQRQSLLDDKTTLGLLPPELLSIVHDQASSASFLDAVAQAALIPRLTGRIFAHFDALFADICARWLLHGAATSGAQDDGVIAAFARVLPFAPFLSVYLDEYLARTASDDEGAGEAAPGEAIRALRLGSPESLPPDGDLLRILLAVWRLVNFDKQTYSRLVPVRLQKLFRHPTPAVRYLAIRIYCVLYSASDLKLESLMRGFIREEESLVADFDGSAVDFTFLTLFEHKRSRDLNDHINETRAKSKDFINSAPFPQSLTPLAVAWGRTVVPRPSGAVNKPSSLVKTPTTLANLESLARRLQQPGPVLLRGLPGCGKTSLVLEAARELGMDSGLVTLHLNEQTDAKTLIGLYSTGTKPGSFQWRPGILTRAVQEGRWVLIEDLDRAPNEVMSTILPLIERRELLIPNRRESIKAPRTFRIFATVRTAVGLNGQETTRVLLGERLWQGLSVLPLPLEELRQVIQTSFPHLRAFVPDILAVYDQLSSLSRHPLALPLGARAAVDRTASLRDLIKWCTRLEKIVFQQGNKSMDEPMSETTWVRMFLDAVDCFAGSIKDDVARKALCQRIGQALRIRPEIVEHALTAHEPQLQDGESQLAVGRAILPKLRSSRRIAKSKRPFATTAHARRLLEQISVAVDLREPVLLVGETGIGKTTVVQQLAESLGHKLVAVNLSQQSEVGDLLGGFKPVNARSLAMPLKEEFEDLFASTGISTERNQKYLTRISTSIAKGKWADVSRLWQQAPKMFDQILLQLTERQARESTAKAGEGQPAKRRRTEPSRLQALRELKPRWVEFSKNLEQFDIQISGGSGAFAFAFVEGKIVKAVRNGDWLLLDEINLASPDTLESIADLLVSGGPNDTPSILLSETGEIDKIQAHPDFRIFGAMNPATDVGKRDLPIGLRSRFTELYVASPDKDIKDLVPIAKTYLKGTSRPGDQAPDRVASLYLAIKRLAEEKKLVDGANEVPHFSLRTLTRVLTYVNDVAPYYGLDRALFEGFCMGFLTLLSQDSENTVMPLILNHIFGESRNRRQSLLSQPAKYPNDGREYVRFMNKDRDRQYWLMKGKEAPEERTDYIRTPYVERNLLNLVRATSTRRFPILIQGPTSAGKTSMIEYLANFSGNKFVRINNHEHTDLQEYLGTYVSGLDGKLRFQEGVLVQAMRQGHWIVLDELNLAPTDVLEALNRLLDDNRELLIPETQEIVRPHESFMLFATQNPPGLYGGRKVLSRAFRNRFLELHFDDIPESELGYILQMRCRNTAPSDCERIVTVYKELSRLRQTSRVFEQKNSFATLRDLFRWALRDAENREEIARNGFMLLAERVRDEEERTAVKEVIETVFKVKINLDTLYDAQASTELKHFHTMQNSQGVVWTKGMRRLYVLVANALRNREPVLLVGETGCGKTTVCQLLAEAFHKELHIVNAHQNTETGDLIGSQRPVRNRGAVIDALRQDLLEAFGLLESPPMEEKSIEQLLESYHRLSPEDLEKLPDTLRQKIARGETRSKALFEWSDGSLVHAMKTGQYFLLDEISLADDSVLERLNSVLEPQRTLLLAEKGADDASVQAAEGFQFFATMNPGGDFGKKELSPALRNRFTEIWVPPLSESQDILDIVSDKLSPELRSFSRTIVDFSYWFGRTFRSSSATAFSIRDILVWVKFVNQCGTTHSSPAAALVHGAATVFIDTLGANPSAMVSIDPDTMIQQRQKCLEKLEELLGGEVDVSSIYNTEPVLRITGGRLWAGSFSIPRSPLADLDNSFEFDAPTTKMNAMRIIRALQIDKPILLEGNPGVGKTTLIGALARAAGQPLTRINLSDQTDLMDLFGTDVPVEGEEAGNFAWRDAPFLQAMQKGEWVLLDEMNLASQSVLEGLNACLDHRGEVYISELDQVFKRHPDFRLFAAQNPHHQGGGRKGLPSSFVNRFVVVYADVFSDEDQLRIAGKRYPGVPADTVRRVIGFMSALEREVVVRRSFGALGSPWEFNLRDTLRWLDLAACTGQFLGSADAKNFLDIAVRQRFRTKNDREEVARIFAEAFQTPCEAHSLYHSIGSAFAQVGVGLLARDPLSQPTPFPCIDVVPRLAEIESLMVCVQQNLPCILSGPSGAGKSALLEYVAALAGKQLAVFPLSADVDTMDLVGGFEQADPFREAYTSLGELRECLHSHMLEQIPNEVPEEAVSLMHLLGSSGSFDRAEDFEAVTNCVRQLAPHVPTDTRLAAALSATYDLLQRPLTLEKPRFEWLDSIIVRAAQSGQWLVLDNANLCSASVLDRLNSLLERPNGFLSINEHSGRDGEPRIITLHPDFRVFLTTDPRHGELSRAMRNRSVEIYIDLYRSSRIDPYVQRIAPVEAPMQRYRDVVAPTGGNDKEQDAVSLVQKLWLDNLSLGDTSLLERFIKAAEAGGLVKETRLLEHLQAALSYVKSTDAQDIRQAVTQQYVHFSEALLLDFPGLERSKSGGSRDSQLFYYMQPLHPLQNALTLHTLDSQHSQLLRWLGVCYEYYLELYRGHQDMQTQLRKANTSRPSSLNRFQRSGVSRQVAAVSGDSTARVSEFLSAVIQAIYAYLRATVDSAGSDLATRRSVINAIMHYWRRTFRFTTEAEFEEVRFQAHLGQGVRLLKERISTIAEPPSRELVSAVMERLEADFATGFKLSTGLSIEVLWPLLRPMPITSARAFQQAVRMEQLAARFDNLKWQASASIEELGKATASLAEAYRAIRVDKVDAEELLQALAAEIQSLELKVNDCASRDPPVFSAEFEALRQVQVLHGSPYRGYADADQLNTLVLSDLPTISQMRLQGTAGPARHIQDVDYLLCQDSDIHPWSGTLSAHLLLKSDSIPSASLLALRSLEVELPILGKALAQSSKAITSDSVEALNRVLWTLLMQVISFHDPTLTSTLVSIYDDVFSRAGSLYLEISEKGLVYGGKLLPSLDAWPAHLADVMREHFYHVVVALAAAAKMGQSQSQSQSQINPQALAAVAWVQFAIGCIKLYTPDKVFDPYLKAEMELDFNRTLRESLLEKASALRRFELAFTGQESSLRTQILAEDIEALGDDGPARPALEIYRPSTSELSQLQRELFNPVLDIIVKDNLSAAHDRLFSLSPAEASQELQVIKANVLRLIQRLSGQFTAYQDLTIPLANLLRCLQLGLSLTEGRGANSDSQQPTSTSALLSVTPFLGGQLTSVEGASVPTRGFEFLSFVRLCGSIDGLDSLSSRARNSMLECFHFFYEEWSKKLEADRRAEEAKNSLYRFRGSAEDEEEVDENDFKELFPSYDGHEADAEADAVVARDVRKPRERTAWDLSAEMARIHRDILQPSSESASLVLEAFCKMVARKVAKEKGDEEAAESLPSMDGPLLPATMLAFGEKLEALKVAEVGKGASYNFYTDPNLPEARKLVSLVHDIQLRFRGLQQVEEIGHLQPLADVTGACDMVLELGHSEPLAKIITRVEKLHEFLYEWQFRGYASRQYGTPALYDRLTAMLVGWRKLELSTWSRLFEAEARRCEQEAGSWWFVAYRAAVAGPLAIVQSGQDPAEHASQLLQELTSYLSGSMVGQFSARLGLLRQIRDHLALLVLDHPPLAAVHNAVENLVSFYRRYEHKATEAITKGRVPLQKTMSDVLLLASWKDTNIVALRESARKSHLKLFRMVRKFRGVLGQPMAPIIAQGLPDEEVADSAVISSSFYGAAVDIDVDAPNLCSKLVPHWGEDAQSSRLANAGKIVGIMARAGAVPESAVPAADILDSFVSDLLSSISALRKETPSTLTEENKDAVKHLKNRKVKLFDDTVKAVRQMGFSRNLSDTRLAAQRSLAAVFPRFEALESSQGSGGSLEYYFHKMLDLAPRCRESLREHHDDLHRDTARRSVGYLEGILFVALQQREFLSDTGRDFAGLEKGIAYLKNLGWAGQQLEGRQQNDGVCTEKQHANHARVLRWLVQIIKVAIHLVQVHSRLGSVDSASITAQLQSWSDKFEGLRSQDEAFPTLPSGFVLSSQLALQEQVDKELHRFQASLDEAVRKRPDLTYILEQVKLWTRVSAVGVPASKGRDASVTGFTEDVLELSGKVLNAVQRFHAAVASLPSSVEEASWLVNYSTRLSAAVRSLRIDTVVGDIDGCIEKLRRVDTDADPTLSRSSSALLRVLLPLLQQYAAVCRGNIAQLAGLHQATCKLGYRLGASLAEVAARGFCTPQEKSDDKQGGEGGKLESGTGLGEGEGAEDISKDVQPDEDLTELAAQAPDKDREGDIEDEKDAVDMGNDELEGELGSVDGADDDDASRSGDEKEEGEEMDEEAGEVDDLDPTAVDEKMWDGNDDEENKAEKEQQGNKSKGQKTGDEQAAADETMGKDAQDEGEKGEKGEENEGQGEDEAEEAAGAEEEEVAGPQEELNRQDQNVQEGETLDLPDDMELDLDGKDEGGSSDEEDGLDDLSDLGQQDEEDGEEKEMEEAADEQKEMMEDGADEEPDADVSGKDDGLAADAEEEEEDGQQDGEEEQGQGEEGQEEMDLDEPKEPEEKPTMDSTTDERHTTQQDTAPNDARGGGGEEQNDASAEDKDDQQASESKAQREQGEMGEEAAEDQQDAATGSKGAVSNMDQDRQNSQTDDSDARPETAEQPFKKLGDVLERWHRNRRDIKAAEPEDQTQQQTKNIPDNDEAGGQQEFQHLQDENQAGETQALGTATKEEEQQPLDESMAIEDENEDVVDRVLPDADDVEMEDDVADKMDLAEPPEAKDADDKEDNGRTGVATRKGAFDRGASQSPEPDDQTDLTEKDKDEDEDVEVGATSTQLSATHITDEERPLRDFNECLRQWATLQARTHALSLALTSQLRLILTPSQATKLSGGFRTGKRLSIRRIIPYIASGYKRDKIWMRRSVPTKRAYQVLLCVDDSRSMGGDDNNESGNSGSSNSGAAGRLALESLVMVARALAMLEAGDVGVLGFGADVFAAHALSASSSQGGGPAFASSPEAGARVLQRFSFRQDRTDVALLVRRVIDHFRLARLQSGGGGEDLWQLALILSDGLTPSSAHERIRRLLREAMEERIMVVFIIMDDNGVEEEEEDGGVEQGEDEKDKGRKNERSEKRKKKRKGGDSVLDLKEARFVRDADGSGASAVVVERYLDTFPFPYYLIVHDLADLPGALAGLLRTWFAEVNA